MTTTITRMQLGSGAFSVNAYLIASGADHVLVDTGTRGKRTSIVEQLGSAGCTPDSLRLILITHGDFDHIGSAAYLRSTFGAPIAMHEGDEPMAEEGDMFAGRTSSGRFARRLLPLVVRLREEDRFEPDVLLDEDSDLSAYGLPSARILLLRGHSAGSIALLLGDGSLLCGDVLENRSSPKLGSIMDDVPTAEASVRRLRTLEVTTVYPGHGSPFPIDDLPRAESRPGTA